MVKNKVGKKNNVHNSRAGFNIQDIILFIGSGRQSHIIESSNKIIKLIMIILVTRNDI